MHPTYAGTGMHMGTFTRLAYKQPQASKGDQEANAGMCEGGMKMATKNTAASSRSGNVIH